MKTSKVMILYATTIALFLLSISFDKYEKLSALLPLVFITLSFFVTDKHPAGYRVVHLIINIQILLYYLFQLLLNVDLFTGNSAFSFLKYAQIDALQMPGYAYIFFILLYWLIYVPFYIYKKRKTDIPQQA